ncbi:ABC transporter ATP-binding protein [Clostridiaceae bacterium M8S5]|nr:ABC transporter ATP-binding protein [Clostridiaceae bacterium M8S5]
MKKKSIIELLKLYLWTLSYFKPFLLLTLIYIACGGVMIWGELMIPRRMGYLIDYILPTRNMYELSNQIIYLFGIVLVILLVKVVYNFLEQLISNKIVRNQQIDLMNKLYELGFSYYERVSTGKILSMFENAVRETQLTYTFLFPHFVYALAQFLVPSIILLSNQPKFFWAAMIGNIIYIVLNRTANKKILHYLDIETKAAQVSQQSFYDVITAKKEVTAMASQEWLIEKTMSDFNSFRVPRMWSIFWRHFRFTTVGFTLTVSIVLFYMFGLNLIKSGQLLFGEFIGYSFLMGISSRGFSVFFYIIPAQLQTLSYAKYLHEFIGLQPDIKEVSNQNKTLMSLDDIEFRNVSFSYNAGKKVIDNVSFKIPLGKRIAFVGESGCGKSTLLKLIGRFYDVEEGLIEIGNENIKNLGLKELRNNFGYVFQDTFLFNISIRDNIRFGKPDAKDEDIINAAKMAGAHEFIKETENGYDTLAGERGQRLSGGQKQRISIARLFLRNPEVILLDEATSALDNITESYIKRAIDKLSENRTVIAVAHRLSTIMQYDHIIYLKDGSISEEGTYDELMNRRGDFYEFALKGGKNEE